MALRNNKKLPLYLGAGFALAGLLAGCGSGSESTVVQGDVPVAYVKRPVSTLGSSTDSVQTGSGGDLYIRERSDPSAQEQNVTAQYTGGVGDVSDPEVSYDARKIIFSMFCPTSNTATLADGTTRACTGRWSIYELELATRRLSRIDCAATRTGDDVDPAYLPDGRIVFSSNRQVGRELMSAYTNSQTDPQKSTYTYHDEYERERVTALHLMDANGQNCRQISFNQSHDRNPTVLMDGRIMYSRWDHVGGRNQFSIFTIRANGTNPFILYGAHEAPSDSFLHPREMADRRVISTLMDLSGTRDGGSLEVIDVNNYTDIDTPDDDAPANQFGERRGQFNVARVTHPDHASCRHSAMRGRGFSPIGRYSSPYPLWDGTNRVLVVWSPPSRITPRDYCPTAEDDRLAEDIIPRYGIYMLDLSTGRSAAVVNPQDGFAYSDPVAIQARPYPARTGSTYGRVDTEADMGRLVVNTVYDTDQRNRMADGVLTAAERSALGGAIPRTGGNPGIDLMKDPRNPEYAARPARMFRITKAVPTPGGMPREALGETEFEMQQIVGYGVIEPDGSMSVDVPANTPIAITALDRHGRGFTPHTNWIQALDGERRFCKGCHSPRSTTTDETTGINVPTGWVGQHPNPDSPATDATVTMAESRASAAGRFAYLYPRPNIQYDDVWTPLYNQRHTLTRVPETSISIGYGGLNPPPAVIGPIYCRDAQGRPNTGTDPNTGRPYWNGNCSIAINFAEHIQPILTRSCATAGCHTGSSASAGLDLSGGTAAVFGRTLGYQELLVGDPVLELDPTTGTLVPRTEIRDGVPEVVREEAPAIAGSSRTSRLIERIFEERLLATHPTRAGATVDTRPGFCRRTGPGAAGLVPIEGTSAPCRDHSADLNASERRVITEWVDMGGQYYNDAFDSTGVLRSNTALLSAAVYNCQIRPILFERGANSCSNCHLAVGADGSRNPTFRASNYVLTGSPEGDFSATASMVTFPAATSYIITRVQSAPHPMIAPGQSFLSGADAALMQGWISNSLACP